MEIRNASDAGYSGVWVFDIEADNLYHGVTKIHCIWMIDPVTKTALGFRPGEVEECIPYLEEARMIIAHNGIDYDVPAIRKFYKTGKVKIIDTLILACMLFPNRLSQSLDSWGKDLGNLKDSFGKNADWSTFTEEMYEYCFQDVMVTVDLVLMLCREAGIAVTELPAYEM